MGMTLDEEIGGAFSLIGLVLVFLFAYFSALWTQIESLVGKAKRNEKSGVLRDTRRALTSKRRYLLALALLIVLQLLLLAPLSFRVLGKTQPNAPFNTIRAGLILVEILILLLLLFVLYLNYRAAIDMAAIDAELVRSNASKAPAEQKERIGFEQFVFPSGMRPGKRDSD